MKAPMQCFACQSLEHYTGACKSQVIKADLTVSEWLLIQLNRKHGGLRAAATAMHMRHNTLSQYMHGTRPMPIRLLQEAGLNVSVGMK